MTTFEERIINELRAESRLVPHATPAPLPQPAPGWPRYLAAAAALIVVVVGTWWLSSRPVGPVASTVTVISATGDIDAEVVDLWVDWWEAWTEVRETATVDGDDPGDFSYLPFEDLATDREVFFEAIFDTLFTVEEGGGFVGIGEPTEVRLTPHIQIQDGQATIQDCVYLDPIPWVKLRESGSAGTVRMAAEMELTTEGWRMSQFGPDSLFDQLTTGDFCQQPGNS